MASFCGFVVLCGFFFKSQLVSPCLDVGWALDPFAAFLLVLFLAPLIKHHCPRLLEAVLQPL